MLKSKAQKEMEEKLDRVIIELRTDKARAMGISLDTNFIKQSVLENRKILSEIKELLTCQELGSRETDYPFPLLKEKQTYEIVSVGRKTGDRCFCETKESTSNLVESSSESDFKKLTKKLFPTQPIPIKEVEKALGIELYEWQREFMLNESMMDIRKASGKTFLIVLMYTLGMVNDLNYDYIHEKSSLYGKKGYTDYVKQLNNEFIEKLKHTNLVLHRIN